MRDDPAHLYAPQAVLDDPAKAAALGEYVRYWALATRSEDGQYLVNADGQFDIPSNWNNVIARQQATIDLLAQGKGVIDRRHVWRPAGHCRKSDAGD